jgi:hypothetical protein
VWLGGTLLLLGSEAVLVVATCVVVAGGELAHCWVLRGHPGGVVLWSALGLAGLTQPVMPLWGCVVVVAVVGFGVWLCVECCIVDASILLWSSV